MNTLAAQQQALLATLFDWPSDDAKKKLAAYTSQTSARGIKVYQANGHALALRALHAAYPVLAQLLGAESFAALARAHWHDQPPSCGDAGRWGGDLADFVVGSSQLQSEPYLADVAQLEWALHCATTATDAAVDAPSFELLAQHDPEVLQLQLAPGCSVLRSSWPVASIWAAHSDHSVSMADARHRLQSNTTETALVWRAGLQPCLRQTSAAEHCLLSALLAGPTLGEALGALDAQPRGSFDSASWNLETWLTQALQSGLLLGVRLTRAAAPLSEINP